MMTPGRLSTEIRNRKHNATKDAWMTRKIRILWGFTHCRGSGNACFIFETRFLLWNSAKIGEANSWHCHNKSYDPTSVAWIPNIFFQKWENVKAYLPPGRVRAGFVISKHFYDRRKPFRWNKGKIHTQRSETRIYIHQYKWVRVMYFIFILNLSSGKSVYRFSRASDSDSM